MLPGLRILFAITLLSVSVVIFALGAAAFLRTAHEDVANAPWRPIETPVTARVDLAPTTLSLLRVEPEATIAVLTARADAAAAASAATAETKPDVPTEAVPRVMPEQSRTEPTATSTPAKPQEPPAAVQADPASAPQTVVAAVEPAREQAPAVTATKAEDTKAAATKSSETKTSETKAAGTVDTQPAPTVVAALSTDKAEQTRTSTLEPVSAPQESLDLPVDLAVPAEVRTGVDTLKANDKAIKTSPAVVAALGEPAAASTPPLPSKEVKIPNPRLDPAVIEARRKQHQQHLAQLRARARAARARRLAAARARAAAQAKAAAASPFGTPAGNTTSNANTRSN